MKIGWPQVAVAISTEQLHHILNEYFDIKNYVVVHELSKRVSSFSNSTGSLHGFLYLFATSDETELY